MTDLRQLRALVAVLDEGTFTDAAIALSTSQASVSRAVADLERELGGRLLQRSNRGALPTVLGRRVAERARRVLNEVAALEQLTEPSPGQLRIGFSWAALGRHTTPLQRRWQAEHPAGSLAFVQSLTPTAGLLEGEVDLAVIRRPLTDERFEASVIGTEPRLAAVAVDDPLARRRRLALADLADRVIAVDGATGTTTTQLWPEGARPRQFRAIHGVEEWLTVIAAGEAVGITSTATPEQVPRPGVAFRPLRDAPPIAVWLAWWRDDPPPGAAALRRLACTLYAGGRPGSVPDVRLMIDAGTPEISSARR